MAWRISNVLPPAVVSRPSTSHLCMPAGHPDTIIVKTPGLYAGSIDVDLLVEARRHLSALSRSALSVCKYVAAAPVSPFLPPCLLKDGLPSPAGRARHRPQEQITVPSQTLRVPRPAIHTRHPPPEGDGRGLVGVRHVCRTGREAQGRLKPSMFGVCQELPARGATTQR